MTSVATSITQHASFSSVGKLVQLTPVAPKIPNQISLFLVPINVLIFGDTV